QGVDDRRGGGYRRLQLRPDARNDLGCRRRGAGKGHARMTVTIRDITAADEPRWREMWDGYCTFYETEMPPDVTDATWSRMLDPERDDFGGLIAEMDGRVVGFANYVLHPYTWSTGRQCYLH